MKCKDHPDEDVVLISFKGNNEFDFLCLECVVDGHHKH